LPDLKPEEEDLASRLLSLLDKAYDTAENPHSFDNLFTVADQFFFPNSAEQGLSSDILQARAADNKLDTHISRIQNLIDRAEGEVLGGPRISPGNQLASLVVSEDGSRITGNSAAAALLNCAFPTSLKSLGLASITAKSLDQCLLDLRNGHFEGSIVIPIQHPIHSKPFLAKCTKLQSRDADGTVKRGLSVIVNHVEWQDDTMRFTADTFGLTPAEVALLRALLSGQSYPEAALAMSKSPETLKAQGKAILRKTGVAQMSDFLNLMLSYAFLAEPTKHISEVPNAPYTMQGDHVIVASKDGRKIQVNRFGLMGGRPLLFFHGLYQGPYLTDELNRAFHTNGFDIIAPSRPGFNRTDPPKTWAEFNDTVTADVQTVCAHFGLSQVDFLVHHAGISFACRAAKSLGDRALSAVMIGAGVPIKDYMLKTMHTEARVAGAAVKYAPKLLDMLLRVGMAKWRRQGAHAYLTNMFKEGSPDLETLNDPRRGPTMEKGILHMISQGSQTIIHDGISAMSDWEPEYTHLPSRQLWLHGAHDPVMNYQFVVDFLDKHNKSPPIIFDDRGGDVLIGAPTEVTNHISQFLTPVHSAQ
jgi:pimeloyl-ACP methyl ester carboxylesterase/DNA-binding CsgD family transcriptional regulator